MSWSEWPPQEDAPYSIPASGYPLDAQKEVHLLQVISPLVVMSEVSARPVMPSAMHALEATLHPDGTAVDCAAAAETDAEYAEADEAALAKEAE